MQDRWELFPQSAKYYNIHNCIELRYVFIGIGIGMGKL